MNLFRVRLSDAFVVECSGVAAALAYLRRGGAQLVGGDVAALRRFEAAEHAAVEAALDDATWRDEEHGR